MILFPDAMRRTVALNTVFSFCLLFFLVLGSGAVYAADVQKDAATISNTEARKLFIEGAAQYGKLDFSGARESLSKAAALIPDNAKVLYLLGLAAYGQGDWQEAAKAFKKVLEIKPDDQVVRVRLAESYAKMAEAAEKAGKEDESGKYQSLADGEFHTAFGALQTAVEANPERTDIRRALGRAASGMGDYKVAVEQFSKVLESEPKDASTRSDLASAAYSLARQQKRRGENVEAQASFALSQKSYQVLVDGLLSSLGGKSPEPGTPAYATYSMLNIKLADSAVKAGDLAAAENSYKSILKSNPKDGGLWILLAKLQERNEDTKAASESYAKAYEIFTAQAEENPDNLDVLYSLAVAAQGSGKVLEAARTYEKILAKDPKRNKLRLALAEIYKNSGEQEKAVELYKEAYILLQKEYTEDPTNLGLNYLLATAAIGHGNFEAAVVAYERILASSPDLYRVRMDLASAYALLKAYDMAKVEFKRVSDESHDPVLKDVAAKWISALDSKDQRNILIGRLSMGYTRDSNPRANPNSTTINTVLGDVILNKDENHKKLDCSQNYSAFLRHVFITPWKPLQWRSTVVWFGSFYQHLDKQDVSYYSVKTGPGYKIGKLDIEIVGLINALEKDNLTYSKGHGYEVNLMYPLNKHVILAGGYKRENKKLYQERDTDATNHLVTFRPSIVWGKKNENRLNIGLSYQAEYVGGGGNWRYSSGSGHSVESDRLRDSYHAQAVSLRYSRNLPWGLQPYVNGGIRRVDYTGRNVLFDDSRLDYVYTYGLGLIKQLPYKFSVDISHQRTNSHSNVDLYDYRRNQTSITLSRDF